MCLGLDGHPSKFCKGLEDYINDGVDNQVGILSQEIVRGGMLGMMKIN